jgi:hypothetical protein
MNCFLLLVLLLGLSAVPTEQIARFQDLFGHMPDANGGN